MTAHATESCRHGFKLSQKITRTKIDNPTEVKVIVLIVFSFMKPLPRSWLCCRRQKIKTRQRKGN